jgi:N-methylhydantoinase B/oxoprolinase/acetone carboxylase alpha subunit
MKRLFVSLLVTLILYIIYVDLSIGTIPHNETIESVEVDSKVNHTEETVIASFSKTVEQGDTVLSIIEAQLDGAVPVPLEKIVDDFILLNKGEKPEEIQAGKLYLFPDYSKSDSNSQ